MYLKRLETVGFKSFAERIHIDFVPGVTAVVGPNGSGKSNITDAIRWVLGEQSVRSLRGSRMEDIIFQGSDTRNALNVAEVTLILDNSDQSLPLDYEEVSVTRRVYRSGASEFYINKQSCRLKDIVDLFMDSGLGREAFSIISQGKVEEILSSKEEDRRVIFEEAAGVLKYKQRKQKAEFKLAETEENLHRVDDIIYEIEQQIDPLSEQAKIAKKYLHKRKQLKNHEISLLITEIEQLHEQWETLLKDIEKEKFMEINLKTAVQKREAQLETKRGKLQGLDDTIEQLQTNLLTATQRLEQFEGQKQVLNERTKHFSENKEKLEQEKQVMADRIETLSKQFDEEKQQLAVMHAKRRETATTLEQLKKKLATEAENITEQLEEFKSEYIEHLNNQAAKRNELQSIREQLEQLKGKQSTETERVEDFKQQREQLSDQKQLTYKKFIAFKRDYEQKEQMVQQDKQALSEQREQFSEAEKKLYDGYQMIAKLNSRKEMLEEMKEDFQGFFHGVRSVLKAREQNKLSNIHGAVIELVEVPKKYVVAIETVLGGQAQHIVVSDDEAARQAINWLKKTNNGRATFLPIRSIQHRFVPKNILDKVDKHPGFIDVAANLVHSEATYNQVIQNLMGNVIIANTLKDANDIAQMTDRRYRIVTLDGDVVHPGGSMSGGAKRRTNQSLFTREKDLQEMTEKLTNFRKRAKTFERQVEEQKETIKSLEQKVTTTEDQLTTDHNELQAIQTEYKRLEMKLGTFDDQMNVYDQQYVQFQEDKQALNNRHNHLEEQLQTIKVTLTSIQEEIDILTKQQSNFEENRQQLQEQIHKFDISLAEQDERLRSEKANTETRKQQLSEAKENYDHCSVQLQKMIDEQQQEATEIELNEQIEEMRETKNDLTEQVQTNRSLRVQQTKQMEDQEREIREENKRHQAFLQQLQEKEVQANRLDVQLENRLSQLQTDYTITFERAQEIYEKTENPDETKEIVEQLKQQIKRLGRVNLGAIDEYERISERYEFLTEQKEDLVEAKQSLFDIIAEMDEEMKERFEETFTQIRKEFTVVFKELFGGGRAELNLTEPANLLDTGIEIIAQPPGKKLQQLGLLSGGERALTAIALLFSILRVRPVPFCVLDEVEAALDEANVVRFAKYVKMHSDETQFIVITHRKGTMEEADVLYGVTMQESGVSRLVSVRLEDTKDLVHS